MKMTKHGTSIRQLKNKDTYHQLQRPLPASSSSFSLLTTGPILSTYQAKSMESIQPVTGAHSHSVTSDFLASNHNLSCYGGSSQGPGDYGPPGTPFFPNQRGYLAPSSSVSVTHSGSSSLVMASHKTPTGADLCTVKSEGTLVFEPSNPNDLAWASSWNSSQNTPFASISVGKTVVTEGDYGSGGTHPRRSTSSWSLAKTLARYRDRLSKSADRLVSSPSKVGHAAGIREDVVQLRTTGDSGVGGIPPPHGSSASRLLKRFSLTRRKSGGTSSTVVTHRQKKGLSTSSTFHAYDQRTSLSILASMSSAPSTTKRLSQTPDTGASPSQGPSVGPVDPSGILSVDPMTAEQNFAHKLSEIVQASSVAAAGSASAEDALAGKWKVQQWLAWREAAIIPSGVCPVPHIQVPQVAPATQPSASSMPLQPVSTSASSSCTTSSECSRSCSAASTTTGSSSSSSMAHMDLPPPPPCPTTAGVLFARNSPPGMNSARGATGPGVMTTSATEEEVRNSSVPDGIAMMMHPCELKRFSSGRWSMSSSSGMTSAASTSQAAHFTGLMLETGSSEVNRGLNLHNASGTSIAVGGFSGSGVGANLTMHTGSVGPVVNCCSAAAALNATTPLMLYNASATHLMEDQAMMGVTLSTNFSSLSSLNTSAGGVSTTGARLSRDSAIDLQQHTCSISNSSSTGVTSGVLCGSVGCQQCAGLSPNGNTANNTLVVPPPPGFEEGSAALVLNETEETTSEEFVQSHQHDEMTSLDEVQKRLAGGVSPLECPTSMSLSHKSHSSQSLLPSVSSTSAMSSSSSGRPPPPPYSAHIANKKAAAALAAVSTTPSVSRFPIPPPRRDSLRRVSSLFPDREEPLSTTSESPNNSPSTQTNRGSHVRPSIQDYDGWHKRLPYKLTTEESSNTEVKLLPSSRTMSCLSSVTTGSSAPGNAPNPTSTSHLAKFSLPKSLTSSQLKQSSHLHLAAISSVSSSSTNSCSPPELSDVQRLLAEANLSSLDLCVHSSTSHNTEISNNSQDKNSLSNPLFQEHPTWLRCPPLQRPQQSGRPWTHPDPK